MTFQVNVAEWDNLPGVYAQLIYSRIVLSGFDRCHSRDYPCQECQARINALLHRKEVGVNIEGTRLGDGIELYRDSDPGSRTRKLHVPYPKGRSRSKKSITSYLSEKLELTITPRPARRAR